MIPSTTENLLFFWIQTGEHKAEHLFTIDERGCVGDVITAAPGYMDLRKAVVDSAGEVLIEAESSVDLFMKHRALVAEFPVRDDERYSISEIIDVVQDLIARAAGAPIKAVNEVCHGRPF